MRLLATFAEQRPKRWPTVPMLQELGPGISATSPCGLAGPRGMFSAIVHKLHDAFWLAMFGPQRVVKLAKCDQDLTYLNTNDCAHSMSETCAAERLRKACTKRAECAGSKLARLRKQSS